MAEVTKNEVVKRDYVKIEDGIFAMTSHRQITEQGNVSDVFGARVQVLADIKQLSDQKVSAETNRKNMTINYDAIVAKAVEKKKELMNAVTFPKNFSEDLLTAKSPESLVEVGMILTNFLAQIKQYDTEIESFATQIKKKISHYNEIVAMLIDLKAKFWDDLEVFEEFSPKLLEEEKKTKETK